MSPNDRLYDELLAPVVEDYTTTAELLAAVPGGDSFQIRRALLRGQLLAFQRAGDRIAEVLQVACPQWDRLRLAVAR